jgi:hypothetical protein
MENLMENEQELEVTSKIVESEEEANKEANKIVYDLDNAVILLMNFNKKSVSKAKNFKKIAKKFNGSDPEKQKKEIFKYIEKELAPIFFNEFSSKFYFNGELDGLDKEILNTYIFGAFLEGHAKKLELNIPLMFKKLVKELTDRAVEEKRKNQ